MAIKLTINKMKSEEAGLEEARRSGEEIDKLKGREKIEFEIKVIKGRIFNVKQDIKNFANNSIFQHKLKLMCEQIKLLESQLENEKKKT